LKETGIVRATGTANVYDREGKPVAWSLVTLIKMPDKTKFSVARGGRKYDIVPTPEGYRWSKAPKCEDVQELEDALRLIREYQIGAVIDRLAKGRISLVADRVPAVSGEPVVLRSDGSPDSYVITLESELRPREILTESAGLNSALRILYSDYAEHSKGLYPKSTQIVLPSAPRRGVEARFDKIEFNPVGLKDRDFAIKGRFAGLF